ncbi:hypothetical protein D3C86_1336840 [compost metagenome]
MLAHAKALLHGRARIIGQVGQQQRAVQARQRMVLADDRADGLGPRVVRAQAGVGGRLEHQSYIGAVVHDALHDLGSAGDLDVQRHLRVAAPVAGQHAVEHEFDEALAQHQIDMAALGVAQAVDFREEALLDVLLALHVAGQDMAGIGGHHAASTPFEQRHAAVAFQRGDGPADGGRVHVQHFGGAAHRTAAHDLHEVVGAAGVEFFVHDGTP